LQAAWHWLTRSVTLRLALFVAVLVSVAHFAKPWQWGWLRPDEAAGIAETFLLEQGANLQSYTQIKTVEREPQGVWAARDGELHVGVDPAVGYLVRYFKPGATDGWTVAVAPTGQIYRVQREQLDDEPAPRLERTDAFTLVLQKLSTDLSIPAYTLTLISDTMISQPQRSDWTFTFSWPQALDPGGTLRVTLAGEAITDLSFYNPPRGLGFAPHRTPRSSRLLGFVLILAGVFLMMHYHRTPLGLKAAGIWGAVVFGLTLMVRGLTFSQAVILMPADSPLAGYLSRIGLSAVIEALQNALIAGLILATGEALSRDVFRGSTTLSRMAPGTADWRAAWAKAARWAFPAAAIVLGYEALAAHYLAPVGLCGKIPSMVAAAMSSPWPALSLPVQFGLDTLWEESLYRLWLLALLMFWLRLPVLAIPLAAGAAAFFAGYDLSQFTTFGAVYYIAWGLVAGWLMLRVGIIAALLFHVLVVGGYASLVMIWTGFGMHIGALGITVLLMAIWIIARDKLPPLHKHLAEEQAGPQQLEILGPNG
jgi:hypothetical protein